MTTSSCHLRSTRKCATPSNACVVHKRRALATAWVAHFVHNFTAVMAADIPAGQLERA